MIRPIRPIRPIRLIRLIRPIFLGLLLAGCDAGDRTPAEPPAPATASPIEVPRFMRVPSYPWGADQAGSCMHAACQNLLYAHGQQPLADYWYDNFGGPAGIAEVAEIARALGLDCRYTLSGDERFLDWCSEKALGAAIYWQADRPGDHAITFCGYDGDGKAVLLGTINRRITRMPKAKFLATWCACGGKALTFVYPRPGDASSDL